MNEEKNQPTAPDIAGEKMKMPENTDLPETNESTSSLLSAPLLFTLAVILVLILAGMFYWFNVITKEDSMSTTPEVVRPTPEENNEPESTTAEAQVETMQAMSTSDELSAIEADIESTLLEDLDAELSAIDAEIDAAASAE